ncbi:hypothetical protein ACHAWF_009695 [Thalassiosira exigua]
MKLSSIVWIASLCLAIPGGRCCKRRLTGTGGCENINGEWVSREYDAFRLPDATAVANYTLLQNQSFTLNVTNQSPGSCYFSATMSNKPELQIAGLVKNCGLIDMVYTSKDKEGAVGGHASAFIDPDGVMTFTFLESYYAAEAFETQLARSPSPPPEAIPCPDVPEDSSWVSKFPFNSILDFDTGRVRLTWDQNQTFNFHKKKGCAFFGFNTWKSEREGGPNNQEVVGVVSSRKSDRGETMMFGAQLGTFASLNKPMILQDDGMLNYWALTQNTGGALYDYFSMDATREFFDPQYLTAPLDGIKTTQGIDLEAEFTDPYPDDDLNTGTDLWQVQLSPVVPDPPLNKSDPSTTYGFDQLSSELGTGSDELRKSLSDACSFGRSVVGSDTTEWESDPDIEAALIDANGSFTSSRTSSVLKIVYWAPQSTTAPTSSCYFAGLHTYMHLGEEIVASVIGSVDGGSDGTMPLHLEMVQGGPCKAIITATILDVQAGAMEVTYACPRSHWEDAEHSNHSGMIFGTVLKRKSGSSETDPSSGTDAESSSPGPGPGGFRFDVAFALTASFLILFI